MDDLQHKLDQLLARGSGGGCPMCGLCTQHSSQLLAQTKLLEALERKVTELRTALEELAQGLDDKTPVPLVALQRRKSLPVRTSVEEVYVHLDRLRDQKISQHTLNVPCGKAVLIEDSEDEILGGGSPLRNDHNVGKSSRNQVAKELSTVVQQLAPSLQGQVSPGTGKVDQAKLQASQKCKAENVAISPKDQSVSKTDTGPSKIHTSPKMLATLKTNTPTTISTPSSFTSPSKMLTKPSEMVTPLKKTNDSPTELRSTLPNELNSSSADQAPSQTNTSPSAIIKPPHKDVPKIATETSPNRTAVSGSNREPTGTSVQKSLAVVPSKSIPHPKFNVTKFTAPASSAQVQKTKLGIPVTSQSVEGSPSKQSSQTATRDAKSPQLNGTLIRPVTPGDKPSSSVTQVPSSPPAASIIQSVSAGPNPPKLPSPGVPQSTSHNLNKTIMNLQTKIVTNTLASSKTSAATTSLKQVYSCPDSLQSLEGSKGKPVGAVNPGVPTTEGIQIKISPATEKCPTQTKTSPKTCFKIIDDVSPQPAPFPHRFVSLRLSPSCDFSIHTREVLGGGRFGKVHKCTDIKSGLRLAAKILSGRSAKEKEMAVNEIEVMNQLNHANILQLFDAFESKNQVALILEYVEGGELFERIVDESCPLTEVDAMVYVKQICEGVQYMHHMYVLHLDLKPENILCVNRSSHQIKIIDFGLARRYKPREKLKVSFGTPEFLAPEVVNFDFVSFPTDMWTLGVVTYMLLSGLSPFLGDDDSETLNNVLTVNWYFDEETFEHVSDEAKDFISNLLIRERSGRLSAAQCLKHPWLNNISEKAKRSNIVLKSQVLLRKYMARRLWKKNYIAIAAANRFKKISSSGSLTSLGV